MTRQFSNVRDVGRAFTDFQVAAANSLSTNETAAANSLTNANLGRPTDPFSVAGISMAVTTADSYNATDSGFLWRLNTLLDPSGVIVHNRWFLSIPEISVDLDTEGFWGNYHAFFKPGDIIEATVGAAWDGNNRQNGAFTVWSSTGFIDGASGANYRGMFQWTSSNPGSGDFITIIPASGNGDPTKFQFGGGGSYTVAIGGTSDLSYAAFSTAVESAVAAGDLPAGFSAVDGSSTNKLILISSGAGTLTMSTNVPTNEVWTMYNCDRTGVVWMTNLIDLASLRTD
jgi:hypothetical protein